jgi:hypothetical protein
MSKDIKIKIFDLQSNKKIFQSKGNIAQSLKQIKDYLQDKY